MGRTGDRYPKPGSSPKGPPSSSSKSHPLMHSNTHPLTEKWQSCASLEILGATVGRSPGKRTAASPRVLGVRTDWGEAETGGGRCKGSSIRRGEGEKVAGRRKEDKVISQQHRAKQEGKPEC